MDYVQQNTAELQPVFYTTGKIGDSITKRVYNIPELHEKSLLLSKHGWLRLFSVMASSNSSLYFVHLFTGSKIYLPCLGISSLERPIFAITAPPTSEDCVIFIVSCIEDKVGNDCAKIKFCHRRQSAWSTGIISVEDYRISDVDNLVFAGGFFYCLHQGGHLSAFSVSGHSWTVCRSDRWLGIERCS
ncbi:unnamed protein product [Dovyalis caffra]|uniref:KIB1-4 beta-propeller domain-containing protein n=1 Tax=Dovyalis caffra TaxID=77055 RepID=A0AAV1S882_9ROSI|nr:unnamed protein product [Dovyalis caffra]